MMEVDQGCRFVLSQHLHRDGVVLGEVDPSLGLAAPQLLHFSLLRRVALPRASFVTNATADASTHTIAIISSHVVVMPSSTSTKVAATSVRHITFRGLGLLRSVIKLES